MSVISLMLNGLAGRPPRRFGRRYVPLYDINVTVRNRASQNLACSCGFIRRGLFRNMLSGFGTYDVPAFDGSRRTGV
jgi:hypothetical protein